MNKTLYVLQARWSSENQNYVGFAQIIDENIRFQSKKEDATQFESKALANGWFLKMRAQFRYYKFTILTV